MIKLFSPLGIDQAQLLFREKDNHVTCILGASGLVGRATLHHLIAKDYEHLRVVAATRNPENLKEELKNDRIECVKADMSAPQDQLVAVLKGVHSVFIITPGGTEERGDVALNAARACKEAKVKFVVLLSLTIVKHQNTTIFGGQFAPMERQFWDLAIPGCILRVPFFLDNISQHVNSVKETGSFSGPIPLSAQFSSVALQDIAEAYRCIIKAPTRHQLRTYSIYSDTFSYKDLVNELKHYFQEVKYVRLEREEAQEEYQKFLAPWQVEGMLELYDLVQKKDPSLVTTKFKTFKAITQKDATSLVTWLQENVKMPRLNEK